MRVPILQMGSRAVRVRVGLRLESVMRRRVCSFVLSFHLCVAWRTIFLGALLWGMVSLDDDGIESYRAGESVDAVEERRRTMLC